MKTKHYLKYAIHFILPKLKKKLKLLHYQGWYQGRHRDHYSSSKETKDVLRVPSNLYDSFISLYACAHSGIDPCT